VVAPQGPPQSYTLALDNFVTYDPVEKPVTIPPTSYVDVPFTLTSVNGFTDTIRLSALVIPDLLGLGPTTLHYRVVDANGNELPQDQLDQGTTVTLGATPLHLKLRLSGANATVTRNESPFNTTRKLEYASVIFGILLLGGARRRSWMGTVAKLLLVVLFVSAVGSVLSSCTDANGVIIKIDLNADPTHNLLPGGLPQDVLFNAD
jgi:hypothetical protein